MDPTPADQIQAVTQVHYGHKPVAMTCPNCQEFITTKTDSKPSALAWILGAVLCFVLCCCIPFCVGSLNQVTHSCPSCNTILGFYKGGL